MKYDFTITEEPKLQEKYYYHKHKSGLRIYILPKNFSTYYAIFATKYGSLERTFRVAGEKDFVTVPDGVAHFLEHKMFEEEDGSDAFEKFAPFGASANAYTSFDKTAYLFSCTDHFYDSLRVLLSFVKHPYFTDANVKKEQGIIGQEIGMCQDRPSTQLYYTLMNALYSQHNIRTEICGTVDTIAKITPDILYRCYRTFYNLSNMALCVVGNVSPDDVVALADELLPPEPPVEIETIYPKETEKVAAEYKEIHMQVARPMFMIGVKDTVADGDSHMRERRAATLNLLLDLLFSETSPLHASLYEAGLISRALDAEYEYGNGYAHALIGGESDDPEKVFRLVKEEIAARKKSPPSEQDFCRVRRTAYADNIRLFDSTEDIGNAFIDDLFSGSDIFTATTLVNDIQYDEVLSMLNEFFKDDNMTLTVVKPKEKK